MIPLLGALEPSVRIDDEGMLLVLQEVVGADSLVIGTPCYCAELSGPVIISSLYSMCGVTGCSGRIPCSGNAKAHMKNMSCF